MGGVMLSFHVIGKTRYYWKGCFYQGDILYLSIWGSFLPYIDQAVADKFAAANQQTEKLGRGLSS